MVFHVPPRNGGQIVEVSYAIKDGIVFRKTHDMGDRTTVYHVSPMMRGDAGDYWNSAPLNRRWRLATLGELLEYALV